MNRCILTYLPLGISFVLWPILIIVGGRDLGAYSKNNVTIDTFVSIMWLLIPLGVVVSFLCSPFLFIFGKIKEAIYLLLLCILLFPLYFVLCFMFLY